MNRILVVDDAHEHGAVEGHSRDTVNDGTTLVVSWNSFGSADDGKTTSQVIHLGDLLHDEEESLRRSILDWLGKLAEFYTRPTSPLPLVFPNLHAWWLLSLTEKNYATTPEFTVLMKLMLLNNICGRYSPTSLTYVGENRQLESVLRGFADMKGLATNSRKSPLLGRLRLRTEALQATIHFARALLRSLGNLHRRGNPDRAALALVGYLIPATNDSLAQSPYWGELSDYLARCGRLLWLYHRSDEMPLRAARTYCRKREGTSPHETHQLIDDFITARVVVRAVRTYFSFGRARSQLHLQSVEVGGHEGCLPLDLLFSHHMRDSLTGSRAVSTMIQCHAYDHLVRKHLSTSWIYLWENKPFEHALVSAIDRLSAKPVVGYSHSVVRRQDHRYFDETRNIELPRERQRPSPTKFAVNGALARQNLRGLGAPRAEIVDVEALRYARLTRVSRPHPTRLLVIGDISKDESLRLLGLTHLAAQFAATELELWFKPHPGSPSHAEMATNLGFRVGSDSLPAIAPTLALAVVGVAGAASVDLTLLGVPVITVLDARTTNLSPLAGVPNAQFARSVGDLQNFITTPRLHPLDAESLMTIARPPGRWLELIGNL